MGNPDDKVNQTGRNKSKQNDSNGDMRRSGRFLDTTEYGKTKRHSHLVRLDKKVSWLLFVVTVPTILTGYMLTRVESQPFPVSLHVGLKILFVILLLFHTIVFMALIKYHWNTQILRIVERRASEASVIKLIQHISGIFVLIFTVIVVVSGPDFYCNPGEPFSLARHVRIDGLLHLFFTIHMGAGLKVALNRRNVASGKAVALVVVFPVILTGVFAAFETGYFMSSTTEAGNRMEIGGASYAFTIFRLQSGKAGHLQGGAITRSSMR